MGIESKTWPLSGSVMIVDVMILYICPPSWQVYSVVDSPKQVYNPWLRFRVMGRFLPRKEAVKVLCSSLNLNGNYQVYNPMIHYIKHHIHTRDEVQLHSS